MLYSHDFVQFFVCSVVVFCCFYQLVIIFVLSDAIVLPRSCFLCMCLLALYYVLPRSCFLCMYLLALYYVLPRSCFLCMCLLALYYVLPRSCFLCMYLLAMYYAFGVMLSCAWSSFAEPGQAHDQYNLLLLLLSALWTVHSLSALWMAHSLCPSASATDTS